MVEPEEIAEAVAGLKRLVETTYGELAPLYERPMGRCRRALHPPASLRLMEAAERELGFGLPALLRAVYTQLGNGGLVLRLIGLSGGQDGFDHFTGMDLVEGYRAVVRHARGQYRRKQYERLWPEGLVPLYDDLGCGMVDYLDCFSAEGRVWRWDSAGGGPNWVRNSLQVQYPSLRAYFGAVITPQGARDPVDI